MPPAARVTDMHVCPKVEPGPVPHVGGPILPAGEPTVIIGFMPAAREGDMAVCVGPPDKVSKGESSVLIGNKPAARLGDPMEHGGVIVLGCPTVLIGSSAQGVAIAAASAKPFCEECEKAKQEAGGSP
ncbi:PAAR domain-containing protein [Sorangium sp. So ce1099]